MGLSNHEREDKTKWPFLGCMCRFELYVCNVFSLPAFFESEASVVLTERRQAKLKRRQAKFKTPQVSMKQDRS